MAQTKAKVFKDPSGNRMLFSMYMYREGDDVPLATTFWDIGWGFRIATGLEMEKGWLEFDDEAFPHVVTDIGSRGFLHGRATALVFAGPIFDEVKAECEAA